MDLDCKDGTCPIDGNKGKQTIRSGKSCLPCSGYKRYSTSNGFGKDSSSSGRLPRDEKKASIGTGSGTIRKDATTPSLPPPRGDVFVPERTTGPTGTTVGANGNPKHDVIRVGEGKGVVTGAATDGGASRPVSMPTANISGGTADAIGGTPARSGRASKGAIVTPAITDAVTTSSVIRTAAPTIPVVRMPSSSSITGLNIPKGVGREISINLPPSVSAKQPSPRGDVVTPKQAAPFVLAPIAPLATQQPRPDYCDATGMNELIACQRGSDGTFPAVSSACAQSFRDLLARGLSVAEIISGNELCSDEFRRLLAGATPTLIEPPKQGAVAAAKGMPLAVAAPTMIVAPGGAPTAVNPVRCMALFLTLPSSVQAAIVGAYPCPMARSLAPEIARGSRAAAADFVQWFGSAFGPASAEVRSFCAAVLNARGIAAAGAPGGIVVHGRAYVQPAGAAKGGMGAAIQSPRGYQGAPMGRTPTLVGISRLGIAHMPPYGRVLIDGLVVEEGEWDRNSPSTWNVRIASGSPHHVVVRSPSGEQRDAGYLTFSGPIMIDWNALHSVKPLTSPGSTGTAAYNAKAAGAPSGKSMVLAGPNARRPVSSVVLPESYIVHGVNTSPSSVAPGAQFPDGMYDSSAAQCLQMLRSIAARDPRAIVAAFHQSGLDGLVPFRLGLGDETSTALALIADCAARRQQYPRQFDAFCRIAAALSGVKPSGYVTRPAGDPPPTQTITFGDATTVQPTAQPGTPDWLAGLQGGGLGPATQGTAVGQGDVAYRPPTDPGLSTTQILGGIGQVGTAGIGVLNSYLDRESRQHIAELAANASSANAQIAANAAQEIARIQADAQVRIAALGPNPSAQSVANALNTAATPPSQGMSTGTTVALAAGGVAIVGGIAYLALSKKGR